MHLLTRTLVTLSVVLVVAGGFAAAGAYVNLRLTVGQDVQVWCYERAPQGLPVEEGSYNTLYELSAIPFGVRCVYTQPQGVPAVFHDMGTGQFLGGLAAVALGVTAAALGWMLGRWRGEHPSRSGAATSSSA